QIMAAMTPASTSRVRIWSMLMAGLRSLSEGRCDERSYGLPAFGLASILGLERATGCAYQVLMDEPSPRSSRLVLAGAVGVALVVGGAGFLLGRTTLEPSPAAVPPPVVKAEP